MTKSWYYEKGLNEINFRKVATSLHKVTSKLQSNPMNNQLQVNCKELKINYWNYNIEN